MVTRVAGHFGARLCGPGRVDGLAQVNDPEARRSGHAADGERGAQGVLFVPQVTDDADVEVAHGRPAGSGQGQGGLVDDVQFRAETRRDGLEDQVVQADQGVGHVHGEQRRLGVAFLETVDVGAGEGDDQRAPGMAFAEAVNGPGAAPGVQGDHGVGRFVLVGHGDAHPVPQVPEDAGPAHRRRAVSRAGLFFRRGNQANLHARMPMDGGP